MNKPSWEIYPNYRIIYSQIFLKYGSINPMSNWLSPEKQTRKIL